MNKTENLAKSFAVEMTDFIENAVYLMADELETGIVSQHCTTRPPTCSGGTCSGGGSCTTSPPRLVEQYGNNSVSKS